MQGAEKFVTASVLMYVRIANFFATPQMGDFSFKHTLKFYPGIYIIFKPTHLVGLNHLPSPGSNHGGIVPAQG